MNLGPASSILCWENDEILRRPQLYGTNQVFNRETGVIEPPIVQSLESANQARREIGMPELQDGEYRLAPADGSSKSSGKEAGGLTSAGGVIPAASFQFLFRQCRDQFFNPAIDQFRAFRDQRRLMQSRHHFSRSSSIRWTTVANEPPMT